MTYYADLDEWRGPDGWTAQAVGWLDVSRPHARGDVAPELFAALFALMLDPWRPGWATAGRHPCPWCRFSGGPGSVTLRDASVPVGSGLLFVPGRDALFVSPTLIVHYIDAHGYRPPDAFLRAIEECPPMRSMAYLKELRRHGVTPRLGRS